MTEVGNRLGKTKGRLQVRALDDLGDGNILHLSLGQEPGHF